MTPAHPLGQASSSVLSSVCVGEVAEIGGLVAVRVSRPFRLIF